MLGISTVDEKFSRCNTTACQYDACTNQNWQRLRCTPCYSALTRSATDLPHISIMVSKVMLAKHKPIFFLFSSVFQNYTLLLEIGRQCFSRTCFPFQACQPRPSFLRDPFVKVIGLAFASFSTFLTSLSIIEWKPRHPCFTLRKV